MLHELVATALKNHRLYADFVQVKNQLRRLHCKCWIAGGAVRDFLLSRTPLDLDLVTDATTEQILHLFPNAIPVGVQFGVVKILLPSGDTFDLATFRRESDYIDGRRPSRIDFATAAEDAERRDFTINALFWDDETKTIVDYVGGLEDLKQKILNCVGKPEIRFGEDYLRVLRLLRFQTQLSFAVAARTAAAAQAWIPSLRTISGERIWSEFQKMLPFIDWELFLKNEFALVLLKSVFPLADTLPLVSSVATDTGRENPERAKLTFLFFLLQAAQNRQEMLVFLKERLHLSKTDLKQFSSLKFCSENKLTAEEWIFEAEKDPQILLALEVLAAQGQFVVAEYLEIENRFHQRPQKIVTGADLHGLVSPEQMSHVLKKIRLLQLKQPDLDKQNLLKLI